MQKTKLLSEKPMKKWGNMLVRIITLPSLMATVALCILRMQRGLFPGGSLYAGIFFLTFLPLAAYPFCYFVPNLRRQGRSMQRKTAVIFSVIGYLGGVLYCLQRGLTGVELTVFLTYLLSGLGILVMSNCFHFKCSGHACGMAGPVTLLGMQVSPVCFLGYGLLVPVFASSVKLKRHTKEELVAGALTPVIILVVLLVM